ncbi:DUF4422 domain-containing protein [Ochrobactrum quorumnocens]|uniref:DUF4422 domain-containing protein n=1 Tax=Ochrobactrum quorumnocens TaxID=271865 RepID=A0A5N1KD12_9HYPH|nr:DUF4422 domain-containing protein [[Ochrobactrum] quorumnocens]
MIGTCVIKIYLSYFADARKVSNSILTPIQVGRSPSLVNLDMIGDDTGDNISDRNSAYCELTGIYWAWKNDTKADYLGFMHYRRFLDFYPDVDRANETIQGVFVDEFEDDFFDEFGLTEERVSATMKDCDGVIPAPINVSDFGGKSVEQQYRVSPDHHIGDFYLAEKVVSELYPHDSIYFKRMAKGKLLYPCNIFIFKRELFAEYCDWVFPILDELHKRINTSNYSTQAKRAVGFLAERLFTTFVIKKQSSSPVVRFAELRLVTLKETAPAPIRPERPVSDKPVTTLVASSDRAYVPHLAALIHSVFDNASSAALIDFIVLDGGLTNFERGILKQIPERYDAKGIITFVDMSRQFLSVDTHSYFSRSTFYRLILPDLLDDYSRVLFLDTDMIVVSDITELYNVNMEGKAIAAAKDLVMKTFTVRGILSTPETGGKAAGLYLSEYLGMGNRSGEYFQAGVILLDLEKMREKNYSRAMKKSLFLKKYWFLDQDIFNEKLLGDVYFIENKWNCLFLEDNSHVFLSKNELGSYEKSLDGPSILHFAGRSKPWVNNDHPFGSYYWYYLRRTHWYESVLAKYLDKSASIYDGVAGPRPHAGVLRRILRKIWRMLPNGARTTLLPAAMKLSRRIR